MCNIVKKKLSAFWTWHPSFYFYMVLLIAVLPALLCYVNDRKGVFKIYKSVNASQIYKSTHGPYSYYVQSDAFSKSISLFEDGKILPLPKSQHFDIGKYGAGRYSVWGKIIYFSASDNSDPRINGKDYKIQANIVLPVIIKRFFQILAFLCLAIICLKINAFSKLCMQNKYLAGFFRWSPGVWCFILLFMLAIPYLFIRINNQAGFITGKNIFNKSKIVPAPEYGEFAYLLSQNYRFLQDMPVMEDGKKLPFANSTHSDIGKKGSGRYFVGENNLCFSSSDNSDPRINNKEYEIKIPKQPPWYILGAAKFLAIISALLFLIKINYFIRYASAFQKYAFLIIVILSLTLSCITLFAFPMILVPDTDSYFSGALTLAENGSFSGVNTCRGPGMALLYAPILLIFKSCSLWPVKILIHLLAAGCNILTYLIAYKLTDKKWLAFLAGICAIVWIDGIFYSTWLSSEIPAAFFLLLFTCFLIKAIKENRIIYYYLTAFSACFATLLRSENIMFFPIFIFFTILMPVLSYCKNKDHNSKRIVFHIILAAFISALPLLGWASYNFQRASFFGLTSYGVLAFHDSALVSGVTLNLNFEDTKSPDVQFAKQAFTEYTEYNIQNKRDIYANMPFHNAWYDAAALRYKLLGTTTYGKDKCDERKILKKIDKIIYGATRDSIFRNPDRYITMQFLKTYQIYLNIGNAYFNFYNPEQSYKEWVLPYYYSSSSKYMNYLQFDTDKPSLFMSKLFKIYYILKDYCGRVIFFLFVVAIPGFIICIVRKPFLIWWSFLAVTFSKTLFMIFIGHPGTRVMFQGSYLYIILGLCTIITIILLMKLLTEKIKSSSKSDWV